MRVILRGRCSIWRCWRMSPVALRIVSDVSYVTRINHESHFAWQAQHLSDVGDVGAPRLANAYFVAQGVVPE